MDVNQVREWLEELIVLRPEYEKFGELLALRGHGADLSGVATVAGSPVENTVVQLEQHRGPLDELDTIAAQWGHLEGDGPTVNFMLGNLARVYQNRIATSEDFETIGVVYRRVVKVVDRPVYGPPCPLHDALPRTRFVDGGYFCSECGLTRSVEELVTLARWTLRRSNPRVTPREAADILGVDENTIRKRITRRKPERTVVNGCYRYNLDDIS